ncbi:MAG: pectin esterase [Prevotella sp.]|nr:pectin esterase [Prevotella sp.]
MRKARLTHLTMLAMLMVLMTSSSRHVITIFMIGDSTMANKPITNGNPERGWGMALQGFFKEGVRIDNHAVNGRSSKSFIDEGRWDVVKERITAGDYVVIQFGHNDEKPDPKRHTDVGGSFDENLRKFVRETREKGGKPILMNAVARRNFIAPTDGSAEDESLRDSKYEQPVQEGNILIDTHGDYRFAPKNVAQEMNVPFVDANSITHDLEQGLGTERSKRLHMWFLPGENPAVPEGRQDNTHYSIYGAHVVAGLLADAIVNEVPSLRKYVRHYEYIVAADGTGNYIDLQEAVNGAPMGKKTKILILNGEWSKPVIPKGKKIKYVLDSQASFK